MPQASLKPWGRKEMVKWGRARKQEREDLKHRLCEAKVDAKIVQSWVQSTWMRRDESAAAGFSIVNFGLGEGEENCLALAHSIDSQASCEGLEASLKPLSLNQYVSRFGNEVLIIPVKMFPKWESWLTALKNEAVSLPWDSSFHFDHNTWWEKF